MPRPEKANEARSTKRLATILIVDDVEDNREMYAEFLRFRGFRVDTAANGEDGLAKALAEPPAVVVLDLTMPRLDGWAFTRTLRAEPRTSDTRIVVLTGHALAGSREGAFEAGAHSFLAKPCLPEDLAAEVQRQLDA